MLYIHQNCILAFPLKDTEGGEEQLSNKTSPSKPLKTSFLFSTKPSSGQENMEEEGIGLVLARATELRLKIHSCIHKATVQSHNEEDPSLQQHPLENGKVNGMKEAEDEEEDDGDETLLNICDALESLETQLSALQNLQQRQRYEREAALSEIDYSRKMLLEKIKDYKGKELAVIHEAKSFAGETVEYNNDLLLPPYPSRPPHSLAMDNGFLSEFPSARKIVENGMKKSLSEANSNPKQSDSKSSGKGSGFLINVAAKAMLTLGVITLLNLAGYGPRVRMNNTPPKIIRLSQQPAIEEKRSTVQCPPGKVLVVENGEARCLVKERVEVPFESVVTDPDVNYGCG